MIPVVAFSFFFQALKVCHAAESIYYHTRVVSEFLLSPEVVWLASLTVFSVVFTLATDSFIFHETGLHILPMQLFPFWQSHIHASWCEPNCTTIPFTAVQRAHFNLTRTYVAVFTNNQEGILHCMLLFSNRVFAPRYRFPAYWLADFSMSSYAIG